MPSADEFKGALVDMEKEHIHIHHFKSAIEAVQASLRLGHLHDNHVKGAAGIAHIVAAARAKKDKEDKESKESKESKEGKEGKEDNVYVFSVFVFLAYQR